MSLGKKDTEKTGISWKQALLWAYIAFTIVLIVWLIFNYFKNVVYSMGVQAGYGTAVEQLMKEVGSKCEPVAVNIGEEQIDIINVACLQQPEAEETAPEAGQ